MKPATKKVKCLVVDDEPLAIKLISSHIQQIDTLEIVATCKNAIQALDILRKEQIELIFLDIHMPQVTGLEFLRTLINPPKVILTTAYREFALEGYEFNVVDYLLKPISFERFLKSVNKFFERVEKTFVPSSSDFSPTDEEFIYIRDNKKVLKIYLKNILFIEAYGEYMKIHTPEKIYLSRETMHDLEERLSGRHFLRIHKSYIVSIPRIIAFSSFSVQVLNQELPLGRSYKDTVLETLNYIGKKD